MKVDFNNLRLLAIQSYHKLCTTLNESMDENRDYMNVSVGSIQEDMDELRGFLYGIACSFQEGDESFKSLGDEIGEIAEFNPEP